MAMAQKNVYKYQRGWYVLYRASEPFLFCADFDGMAIRKHESKPILRNTQLLLIRAQELVARIASRFRADMR